MGGEGNLFFAGGEGGVNPKRRKKKTLDVLPPPRPLWWMQS